MIWRFRQWFVSLWQRRLVLPLLLILCGALIVGVFGDRSLRSFRQVHAIQRHGFVYEAASLDALRPWMSIRFVAVSYAVPEEYLFSQLAIPAPQRHSDQTLMQLNDQWRLGRSSHGDYPAIIDTARTIITTYRATPVATGLDGVLPWMSMQYIANSTGVPVSVLFMRIGLSAAGNENKPLFMLSDELRYSGGSDALVAAVSQALAQEQKAP